MKKLIALTAALLLLALPVLADAAPEVTARRTLSDSVSDAWDTFSTDFAHAFHSAYDGSCLSAMVDSLHSRLSGWDWSRVGAAYDEVCARANEAGVSLGEWLDSHTQEISDAARTAGDGIGSALEQAGGALEQAGNAAGDFLNSLFGDK